MIQLVNQQNIKKVFIEMSHQLNSGKTTAYYNHFFSFHDILCNLRRQSYTDYHLFFDIPDHFKQEIDAWPVLGHLSNIFEP